MRAGMWRIKEGITGSNAGHIYDVDGTDSDSLTGAVLAGRKQVQEYRTYYRDYLNGYEKMELMVTAPRIGIRETRRILGEYVLNLEDFMRRAVFDDEIGRYSYPVDIHAGKNTHWNGSPVSLTAPDEYEKNLRLIYTDEAVLF